MSLVVGITGGSGSGKTTFAARLRERLQPDVAALAHDDYYWHKPEMTPAEAAEYDFDSPDALETSLLIEHLRSLKGGTPVQVPSYDFATHARSTHTRRVDPASVILVEGLLIMCEPALMQQIDLTVFVDAEPDVRVLRRIERDCLERGATLERALNMYFRFSKPAHDKYVEPFKNQADIVIPNALDEKALEMVAQGIAALAKQE